MSKNRNATVIALFLMFAMAFSLFALPSLTSAQSTDYYSGSYYGWPLDSQLTEWQEQYFAELHDGPLSAHIRWVTPFAQGGLAGGDTGEHALDCGDAYQGKWRGSIVGNIVFTDLDDYVPSAERVVAHDIRTGELLWQSPPSSISGVTFTQTVLTPDGIDSYLWRSSGGTYSAYDPWTMQWVYDITDVPSGSRTTGEKGEIIIYSLSLSGGYMNYWNQLWMLEQPGVAETLARERSVNATEIGWTDEWTIPEGLEGSAREYRWGDRVIGTYENTGAGETTMWAFSLVPGEEGELLYKTDASYELAEGVPTSITSRLLVNTPEDSGHLHFRRRGDDPRLLFNCYSYATGEELWRSEDFPETSGYWGEDYLNHFGTRQIAGTYDTGTNGYYYTTGYSGIVYAYHASGLAWTYHADDPYSEILWANSWGNRVAFIIGGKLYIGHDEHSPIDPKPRGAPFICLNATTGEEIWRVDGLFRQTGWGGRAFVGSGVMMTQDTYDQRTYCVGKGPSATTVTAPDAVVPFGSTALIQGTVMDISPGCSDIKVELRFPYGVPAVSDANMSEWMLYVYKQFPRPADAVGVDVELTLFGSNGQVVDTATVTSDADGDFKYKFVAEDAGEYSVEASFAGSDSYYGSFAVSSPFVVEEAPEPTAEPTPKPESVADAYFVPAVAGIIVALVVVGAVLVLLLRKR